MMQNLNPVNPLFAVGVILIALFVAYLLVRALGQPPVMGRFSSLDGLRGFLVIGVFLHHSAIWYFYLHTGKWEVPPSNLYTNFGESSVALFFMITGFLFYSKLLNSREKPLSWLHIYVSRVLRLLPLYCFAVATIVVIVFAATNFKMNEGLLRLAIDISKWLAFTVSGGPDLNGFHHTAVIIARVTWSLPYEWLFYAALPLGALVLGMRPPSRVVIFSLLACGVIALVMSPLHIKMLGIFGGGIFAAFCVRSNRLCHLLSGTTGGLVAIACFSAALLAQQGAYNIPSFLLLTIGFVIIACGNTLFGVLIWPSSRLIGDMGYSIYLLHGILLFITFHFIFGDATAISPLEHWLIVFGLVVPLIAICYATFRLIELPCMKAVPSAHSWLASKYQSLFKHAPLPDAT